MLLFGLAIVDKSYTEFEHPEVVTTHPLQDGVTVGELFHGPTGAFKDLALCLLGQCLELVLSKRQKRVTILVGTSGDTGSSAARSVRGLDWANIIVLYPANNVSKVGLLSDDVEARSFDCILRVSSNVLHFVHLGRAACGTSL